MPAVSVYNLLWICVTGLGLLVMWMCYQHWRTMQALESRIRAGLTTPPPPPSPARLSAIQAPDALPPRPAPRPPAPDLFGPSAEDTPAEPARRPAPSSAPPADRSIDDLFAEVQEQVSAQRPSADATARHSSAGPTFRSRFAEDPRADREPERPLVRPSAPRTHDRLPDLDRSLPADREPERDPDRTGPLDRLARIAPDRSAPPPRPDRLTADRGAPPPTAREGDVSATARDAGRAPAAAAQDAGRSPPDAAVPGVTAAAAQDAERSARAFAARNADRDADSAIIPAPAQPTIGPPLETPPVAGFSAITATPSVPGFSASTATPSVPGSSASTATPSVTGFSASTATPPVAGFSVSTESSPRDLAADRHRDLDDPFSKALEESKRSAAPPAVDLDRLPGPAAPPPPPRDWPSFPQKVEVECEPDSRAPALRDDAVRDDADPPSLPPLPADPIERLEALARARSAGRTALREPAGGAPLRRTRPIAIEHDDARHTPAPTELRDTPPDAQQAPLARVASPAPAPTSPAAHVPATPPGAAPGPAPDSPASTPAASAARAAADSPAAARPQSPTASGPAPQTPPPGAAATASSARNADPIVLTSAAPMPAAVATRAVAPIPAGAAAIVAGGATATPSAPIASARTPSAAPTPSPAPAPPSASMPSPAPAPPAAPMPSPAPAPPAAPMPSPAPAPPAAPTPSPAATPETAVGRPATGGPSHTAPARPTGDDPAITSGRADRTLASFYSAFEAAASAAPAAPPAKGHAGEVLRRVLAQARAEAAVPPDLDPAAGARLLAEGHLEEAVRFYEARTASAHATEDDFRQLGRAFTKLGRMDAAVSTWERLHARFPDSRPEPPARPKRLSFRKSTAK